MKKNAMNVSVTRVVKHLGLSFLLILLISAPAFAENEFIGTYSGTYSGDLDGKWMSLTPPTGDVIFYLVNQEGEVDSGIHDLDNEGNLEGTTIFSGSKIFAKIDENGNVSGTWENEHTGVSGVLEGALNDPVDVAAFAGSYSGQFTGGFNGEWSLQIEETGFYSGMIESPDFTVGTGVEEDIVYGMLDENGRFAGHSELLEVGFSGQVDENGEVDGIWTQPSGGAQGILYGSLDDTDDGDPVDPGEENGDDDEDDGSSSDSGCFINSL